jgi:iron(III) transport system substrate-binding protein
MASQVLRGSKNLSTFFRLSLIVLSVWTWITPLSVLAAPKTVAEIANYNAPDRQNVLEAGAKQEAALLLYTTGTQIKPILDRFSKLYPYIKLELQRGDNAEIARRIIEEYRAGLYQADGFELASEGLVVARENQILQPFYTPEEINYDPKSIETKKHWISVRESYGGIGYNTSIIPPDQAPKTWADLADPRFKGMIGISGSPSVTAHWTAIMVREYGPDILKKIVLQNLRVYNISSRALANLTVSGEVPISARASNAHFIESKKNGASVGWVIPGPVAVTDSVAAITTKAPHPHSMMLLIDFLLTKEAQAMYQELGYDSARLDLKSPDSPKEKIYFSQEPGFFEDYEKWTQMFDATFTRKR